MTYDGFTTSKGLTIVGEAGPANCGFSGQPGRPCLGTVGVQGLPVGEEFVLRGFSLGGEGPVFVASSAGVVWIEDCRAQTLCFFCLTQPAVQVHDSSKVVWIRSTTAHATLVPIHPGGARGLLLDDSTMFAFESVLDGQFGISGSSGGPGGAGGSGATLTGSSFLFASGSSFRGGAAGRHVCTGFDNALCSSGGSAGIGLRSEGTSQAQLLDSLTLGGSGASALICLAQTCPATPPGAARLGTITDIPLPARKLEVETPVVAGGSYRLTVVGQPGETVFTMYSEHAEATYVPLYFGPQITAHPIEFVLEGVIPASGTLEKDVPVPPLNLLTRFHRSFVQGLLFDELANAYADQRLVAPGPARVARRRGS